MNQPNRKPLIQNFLASPFWDIPSIDDSSLPLYDQALTHSSYANEQRTKGHPCEDYERLEFLGDRILNCAIAEFLYQTYPQLPEGDLSDKIKVTQNENLARIVTSQNLGIQAPLLNLGNNHHSPEDSILADVFEALIGAIYLDPNQGLAKVHQLVKGPLSQHILAFNPDEDYISRLNIYAQQFFRKPLLTRDDLAYEQLSDTLDPENRHTFVYAIRFQGKIISQGTGKNCKAAQQAAAREALCQLERKS
jgi:ribonuclease III